MSLYIAHPADSVVPAAFSTARLYLRVPRAGDGALVNAVIRDSFETLQRWMPWARRVPTVAESETFAREAAARFRAREDVTFLIFQASDELLLGATSLHSIDWSVPRFEIGYWLRSNMEGHGYMTEAVRALTAICLERLGAMRVEIRCDSRNERSAAVARRAGFPLEATLRQYARDNEGELRDTLIFALLAQTPAHYSNGDQRG
jgi:RimJ/RimL family protein N-acetyltransferase